MCDTPVIDILPRAASGGGMIRMTPPSIILMLWSLFSMSYSSGWLIKDQHFNYLQHAESLIYGALTAVSHTGGARHRSGSGKSHAALRKRGGTCLSQTRLPRMVVYLENAIDDGTSVKRGAGQS